MGWLLEGLGMAPTITHASGFRGGLGAGCQRGGLAAPSPWEGGARGGWRRACGAQAAWPSRAQRAPRVCGVDPAAPRELRVGGLQPPGAAAARTIHALAAIRVLRASHTRHGARARRTAAGTGWQCHREPVGCAPRLTVAALR